MLSDSCTHRLVELVRQHMAEARAAGKQPVLWGAKITGGGCGGTVCILGEAGPEAQAAVEKLVAQYSSEVGQAPKVFEGSSSGAVQFGHLVVRVQ